jgi:hypothetical protein
MKQIQIGQFDPARLFTYLLSRLVDAAHSVEDATRKSGSDKSGDERSVAVLADESRWGNPQGCRTTLAVALLLNWDSDLGRWRSMWRNMIFMKFLYLRTLYPSRIPMRSSADIGSKRAGVLALS